MDNTATAIDLDVSLTGTANNRPEELGDYSLVPGSYLWIESPTTPDYRQTLAAVAWNPADPDRVNVTAAVTTDNSDGATHSPGDNIETDAGVDTGVDYPDIAGLRVYIRRFIDTRSREERRYSLLAEQPNTSRTPQRDYIIRTTGDGVGNAGRIDCAVLKAGPTTIINNGARRTEIEFKQINPDQAYRASQPYRPGDTLVPAAGSAGAGKHYICTRNVTSPAAITQQFLDDNFEENFVHMQTGGQGTGYMPEDFFKNVQPILIFDNDTDPLEASTRLGWIFDATNANSVWRVTRRSRCSGSPGRAQYLTSTDYRGLDRFLTNYRGGEDPALPQLKANRDVLLGAQVANLELRRPSIIRMYGHAFEWAGFGNYSKGLPQYQGGMSGSNKFTYYGTNELGGRVYFTGFNEEGFNVSPAASKTSRPAKFWRRKRSTLPMWTLTFRRSSSGSMSTTFRSTRPRRSTRRSAVTQPGKPVFYRLAPQIGKALLRPQPLRKL